MPSATASTRPTCSATGASVVARTRASASLSQRVKIRQRCSSRPNSSPIRSRSARQLLRTTCCGCAPRCRQSAQDRRGTRRPFPHRIADSSAPRTQPVSVAESGAAVTTSIGVVRRRAAKRAFASGDRACISRHRPSRNAAKAMLGGKRARRRCAISTESSRACADDHFSRHRRDRARSRPPPRSGASRSPATIARADFPSPSWRLCGASAISRSRSAAISARAFSASARHGRCFLAGRRRVGQQLVRLPPAAWRRCSITGRKKNRPRSQMRTRTLTVWSASVHQSIVHGLNG